jgi:hypothetical protein
MNKYSFDTRAFVIKKHMGDLQYYAIGREEWENALEWVRHFGHTSFPNLAAHPLYFNENRLSYEMLPTGRLINFDDLEWSWHEVFNHSRSKALTIA